MAPKPRLTIGRLMIVIALFGVLFALPTMLGAFLGGLTVSGLVSWCELVALWRYFGWDSTRGGPQDVAALTILAVGLDVASWVCLVLVALRFPNDSTWSSPVIASCIAVAMLGTLAFVLALTALLGPGEGRSAGMKLVAFFAAITAFPFQFGLGFWLVLLVTSPFH